MKSWCRILAFWLWPAALWAQAPGSAGYKTEAQQRNEFIAKLRRDIAKVAHSADVTKELISRSRGAPFLPDIYLRLAELYVEQARYEFYLVHEELGESSKGSAVAPTAKLLKERAVETYERILSEFPDYKDNDKVLFFLGHEYRELGRYEDMITQYEKLVGKYPKSSLVLDAYLVLGDYRFDKQDLVGAKRYYQKILDLPTGPVHDMAHFKMGWVYLNEVDYKEALNHFEAAVKSEFAPSKETTRREQERRVNVKQEALVDLAYAYTEVKKPEGALKYFRGLAPSRNMYLLALQKLAKRYFVKQDFDSAANIYREVAELSYDAETNLDAAAQIHQATINAAHFRTVHRDVAVMLKALDDYRFDWRVPQAQRDAATKDVEQYARDLATRGQTHTQKDKTIGTRVAAAYARYLDSFPAGSEARAITENLADTLYEARLHTRAGDRYEEAARLAQNDPKGYEEALYNACAAFHAALKDAQKMPRFDRIWAQQGLIRNGVIYVENFPKSDKVPEIKLNIGRSYYEAGEFEQGVGVFEEFLASYPNHPSAITVAELILDSYAQQQNFAKLSEKAKQLAANPSLGDATFKNRLLSMAKGAEERQIGEVILTASVDKSSGGDAGEQLRKYWEQNKTSPVAEKTLYTAFVQYKEARDLPKALETGNQFIGAYPQSQYLGDIFGSLAAFTYETGNFEQAMVYLEEYHRRFPGVAQAQRALYRAGVLKQLLGDHRGAIAAFEPLLTAADPELRADAANNALLSYEKVGDWDGLDQAARKILAADPGQVRAHTVRGLVAQQAGNLEVAAEHFENAVKSAGRGASGSVAEDAARAAFGLGDLVFRQFERIGLEGDLQTAAAAKAELLAELENAMVDAVAYNRGTWAVAALHRVGLAYASFARFLESAPVPEGLAAGELQQYQTLVAEQVAQIQAKANDYFDTCLTKARSLGVMSAAVLGCHERGPEATLGVVSINPQNPRTTQAALEQALAKNPKDLDVLDQLAELHLLRGEAARAKLVAGRGSELDERDGRFFNKLGMAELALGQPQEAYFAFKKAAELGHPYAAASLAALLLDFKDTSGAARAVESAKVEIPPGAVDIHPRAAAALTQIEGN